MSSELKYEAKVWVDHFELWWCHAGGVNTRTQLAGALYQISDLTDAVYGGDIDEEKAIELLQVMADAINARKQEGGERG